jgi:hypothetical protein
MKVLPPYFNFRAGRLYNNVLKERSREEIDKAWRNYGITADYTKLCDLIAKEWGWSNNLFHPDDECHVLFSLWEKVLTDDMELAHLLLGIQKEFDCEIPDDVLENFDATTTLRQFLGVIVGLRDKAAGTDCIGENRQEHTQPLLPSAVCRLPTTIIAAKRNEYAEWIEKEVIYRSSRPRRRSDMADKVLCHPIGGLFCVAAILFLMFSLAFNLADSWHWFPWASAAGTFEWQTPLGAIDSVFRIWTPLLLDSWFALPDGDLRSLIYDGILAGVGGVVMFIPIIFFIFLLVAALEQSGYMARVVVALDRLMRLFG